MTKVLLILLFFTLPLIHGRIFPTLGIDIYFAVSGNFEFTKVIYFNILSSLIFTSFFIEYYAASFLFQRKEFRIDSNHGLLLIALLILILSTLFSLSPFISLIGDLEKGHTALMFLNLLGLLLVLTSLKKKYIQKLIYASLLAGIFVSLLSVKELFFQTYDYGALSSRGLGSFGHPNYLAGYLLILLPLACSPSPFPKERIQVWIQIIAIISICLGILFSQSIVAIVLAILYLSTLFHFNFTIVTSFLSSLVSGIPSLFKGKKLQYIALGGGSMMLLLVMTLYLPEKLHSFFSRFYLWETTLKIIFSDIKIFLIGGGAETLPYYFDSFKVAEVYIYENYGFTADRPHNFILNIFYHFGIFALGMLVYLVYSFIKYFKNTPENLAILLFLLFGIIHYFSIASYALVLLIIASRKIEFPILSVGENRSVNLTIISILTLISLTGAYYSTKLYHSEILYSKKQYIESSENITHPKYLVKLSDYSRAEKIENTISQSSFKSQIQLLPEKKSLCNTLTINYPSAENFIYCGDIFWKLGKQDLAKEYYNAGLNKLPDLWNNNSLYWDNYFIKNTITGNRFFSEKFGNINLVLEKVGN